MKNRPAVNPAAALICGCELRQRVRGLGDVDYEIRLFVVAKIVPSFLKGHF
jgi:hypothetical protein